MNEDGNETKLEFAEITDKVGVERTIYELYNYASKVFAEQPRYATNVINALVCILNPYKDKYFRKRLKSVDEKYGSRKYKYNYYRLRAVSDLLDRVGIGLERDESPKACFVKLKTEMVEWVKSKGM